MTSLYNSELPSNFHPVVGKGARGCPNVAQAKVRGGGAHFDHLASPYSTQVKADDGVFRRFLNFIGEESVELEFRTDGIFWEVVAVNRH